MDRPLLIYDGQCGFCKIWVRYWQRLTGDRVAFAPSQEVAPEFPEISSEQFKNSVWLVNPNRSLSGGACAAFELIGHIPGKSWPLWLYRNAPGFAWISEGVYRFI